MTNKMMLFCLEYMRDLEMNATAAYMRAYNQPNPEIAKKKGYELLKRKDIQEYVGSVLKQIEKDSIADIEEVMEYLTSVMRGKDDDKTILKIDGNDTVRYYPPGTKEKLKAAELLGKRLGLDESELKTMIAKAKLDMEERRLQLQEIKEKGDSDMLEKLDNILGAIDKNV